MELRLAHLYPELLNIYGDYGNVLTLKKRCEWRGITLYIDNININDEISSDYDLYFIGGGQDTQQKLVADKLQKYKSNLLSAKDNQAVFLAICGGYQLLGNYYLPSNSQEEIKGVGLLDLYTTAGNKRFIGNVVASCDFLPDKTLVGFENHSGLTYLENSTKPLAKILSGAGNNNSDKTEGARSVNVFGTYLHGSLLPKNPSLADFLIKLALEKRYKEKIELQSIDDKFEITLHQKLVKSFGCQ